MTLEAQTKQYGTWKSPISSDTLVDDSSILTDVLVDREDLYWTEMRPKENGRSVIIKQQGFTDVTSRDHNVRTTVHEYGGGAALVVDQNIYFTNYKDQEIYKIEPNTLAQKVTNAPNLRFADYVLHPNGLWLYAVVEDHTDPKNVQNTIARVDLDTGHVQVIVKGHNFYISPRLNKDGNKLAYVHWNFPNMPWNGTELWVADLNQNGMVESQKKIAGGVKESVLCPSWSPFNNKLYYISDKTGFWNLYEEEEGILVQKNAEFTKPPWILGRKNYSFIKIGDKPFIATLATEKAIDHLLLIDLENKTSEEISLPYSVISCICTRGSNLILMLESPTVSQKLVEYNPATKTFQPLVQGKEDGFSSDYISEPKQIEFPTENQLTAYAFFYAPKNPDYQSIPGEKPPLVVMSHGGPTSHYDTSKSLKVQYWTTRGFAVALVNYGGSTGYGKNYQDRLLNSWGSVDVDDCCNAAKYLAEKGLVDPKRMAITGGSAGGYTTCAALTFRDTFQAGASYYGVSDIELLVADTHKFESKYFDLLVGRYPEEKEKYHQLSPAYHTEKLSCPIIFLQGSEDKIVPPNQAEKMYSALMEKKLPTAYLLFEGEQHGFRKAENIKTAIDAVFFFFTSVFNIPKAEDIPTIAIDNLSVPKKNLEAK